MTSENALLLVLFFCNFLPEVKSKVKVELEWLVIVFVAGRSACLNVCQKRKRRVNWRRCCCLPVPYPPPPPFQTLLPHHFYLFGQVPGPGQRKMVHVSLELCSSCCCTHNDSTGRVGVISLSYLFIFDS